MAGMADDHHRLAPPGDRGQGFSLFRVADDAEVGVVVLDFLDHAMRMEILQPHRRPRMLLRELLHERAHVVKADRVDRRDHQPSRFGVVQRFDLNFQLFVLLHQLAAAVVVAAALFGQLEGTLRAIEELDAKPLFQGLDHVAHVRLRNVVVVGRAGEAPPVDYVAEDFE